jgi:CRP-like cAMP-binding protein
MDARQVIAANPFFAEVLDQSDLVALARRALVVDRPSGTELIHEDGADASLFIIVDGEVEVTTGDPKHGKHIATLGPGAFFGEMSLMTGERRSATVRALTDVKVLEITASAIAPFLEASPELVERFAKVLKKRQEELDRAYGTSPMSVLDHGGFAVLIRRFFGGAT